MSSRPRAIPCPPICKRYRTMGIRALPAGTVRWFLSPNRVCWKKPAGYSGIPAVVSSQRIVEFVRDPTGGIFWICGKRNGAGSLPAIGIHNNRRSFGDIPKRSPPLQA